MKYLNIQKLIKNLLTLALIFTSLPIKADEVTYKMTLEYLSGTDLGDITGYFTGDIADEGAIFCYFGNEHCQDYFSAATLEVGGTTYDLTDQDYGRLFWAYSTLSETEENVDNFSRFSMDHFRLNDGDQNIYYLLKMQII